MHCTDKLKWRSESGLFTVGFGNMIVICLFEFLSVSVMRVTKYQDGQLQPEQIFPPFSGLPGQ